MRLYEATTTLEDGCETIGEELSIFNNFYPYIMSSFASVFLIYCVSA